MPDALAVRRALGDDFRAAFTAAALDVDVIDNPRADGPEIRPRVVIALRQIRNADVACPYRRCALDVHAVVPNVADDGSADDALDAFVSAVLAALDGMRGTSWELADRGVFLDNFPSYRVAVERTAE